MHKPLSVTMDYVFYLSTGGGERLAFRGYPRGTSWSRSLRGLISLGFVTCEDDKGPGDQPFTVTEAGRAWIEARKWKKGGK